MADFQNKIVEFDQRSVALVAATADSLENGKKTVEQVQLTYPLAYGLDAREFSAKTGAFFDEEKNCLQSTGFILDHDGKVTHAVYSTGPGPMSRYVAADCLDLVDYLTKLKG